MSKADSFKARFNEFVKFVGARLSTMVIEVGGVWLMADVMQMNDLIAKFIIQFIVLALNYIFSKFLVFKKKPEEK
jgi:putative flippase GtrA